MHSTKTDRLEQALDHIRARWGSGAIDTTQRSHAASAARSVPTGHAALDAALTGGGVPRGHITELIGVGTSGTHTLALSMVAHAQAAGGSVAYVDCAHRLDVAWARGCGVDVTRLLRVCPAHGVQALAITETLITRAGVDLLVFDSVPFLLREPRGAQALSLALRRLRGPLTRSATVLLFLATPLAAARPGALANGTALPHYAAVRLLIERHEWLTRHDDSYGYTANATVLKQKFGRTGHSVNLRLVFNQGQQEERL